MAGTFFWRGNHPALDLVNTVAVDGRGEPLELLGSWTDAVIWAESAGLVEYDVADACKHSADRSARIAFDWVKRLRDSARDVLDPVGQDRARGAGLLAEIVAEVPVRLTYRPEATIGDPPVATATPIDALRLALTLAVLDATRLEPSRIRRCEGVRCVLVYYDTSKNRSRRWCDMATCGNQAKAAAYYQRSKHPHHVAVSREHPSPPRPCATPPPPSESSSACSTSSPSSPTSSTTRTGSDTSTRSGR